MDIFMHYKVTGIASTEEKVKNLTIHTE